MTKEDVVELLNGDKPIYFLTNTANFNEYYDDYANSSKIWGFFLDAGQGEGSPVTEFEDVSISRWYRSEELEER